MRLHAEQAQSSENLKQTGDQKTASFGTSLHAAPLSACYTKGISWHWHWSLLLATRIQRFRPVSRL